MNEKPENTGKVEEVPKILAAIGSPLKLFALAIIVCNTVFGVAASTMNNPELFKFAIHMFLAIVGAFLLIALWSPRSLYHPTELLNVPVDKMPKEEPIIATIILCGAMAAYMLYYSHPW